MSQGHFIVIEGIDGAGTTTQAHRLAGELVRRGRLAPLVTREPSGGPVGRLLRAVIERREERLDEPTMALCFAADRLDHLSREIVPALAEGRDVISDRYVHSSLAYQGSATDVDWVAGLNARARRPDVTYLLEVPVELAAARRGRRQAAEEIYDEHAVQRRVAEIYRRLPALLGETAATLVVLDGSQSPEAITQAIVEDLDRRGWL